MSLIRLVCASLIYAISTSAYSKEALNIEKINQNFEEKTSEKNESPHDNLNPDILHNFLSLDLNKENDKLNLSISLESSDKIDESLDNCNIPYECSLQNTPELTKDKCTKSDPDNPKKQTKNENDSLYFSLKKYEYKALCVEGINYVLETVLLQFFSMPVFYKDIISKGASPLIYALWVNKEKLNFTEIISLFAARSLTPLWKFVFQKISPEKKYSTYQILFISILSIKVANDIYENYKTK